MLLSQQRVNHKGGEEYSRTGAEGYEQYVCRSGVGLAVCRDVRRNILAQEDIYRGHDCAGEQRIFGYVVCIYLRCSDKGQWHRKSTMKRFTRCEKASMKPMVNKATDEGITGEAIIG